MDCSKVITIPQETGTCWFNSLITVLFYSQGVREIMLRAMKHWKVDKSKRDDNKRRNLTKIYEIFRTILTTKYDYTMDDKAFEYFKKVTPDHILELLNYLNPEKFAYIPSLIDGYSSARYLPQLMELLRIGHKTRLLYHDEDKVYTQEINAPTNITPEIELLIFAQASGTVYTVQEAFKFDKEITYDGQEFILDGMLLVNFDNQECSLNHQISGITCNGKRYVYNSWTQDSSDKACSLFDFDWAENHDDVCFNMANCTLENKVSNLCFNFGKGSRAYFYVRKNAQTEVPEKKLESPSHVKKRWAPKNLECVRQVSNWATLKPHHKFDSKVFDVKKLSKDIPEYSPKMKELLDNIDRLNTSSPKQYKHFIFSDLQYGYGAKIIASALMTRGYKPMYDAKLKIHDGGAKHFALLSSTSVHGKPLPVAFKKDILKLYNSRPDNVHGEKCQIIILDSGFKEGIDLFDVKYVHIFEPQTSLADLKQVIGRATRTCGQKGLEFQENVGWPLDVFIYDTSLHHGVKDKRYYADTLGEMYYMNRLEDLQQLKFSYELEKYSVIAAVDYELNKNIHFFKPEDDVMYDIFSGGGSGVVECQGKCSTSRPTKDVPANMNEFILAWIVYKREHPNEHNFTREHLCELLKNDREFCSLVKSAHEDPGAFVKKHSITLDDLSGLDDLKKHRRTALRGLLGPLSIRERLTEKPKIRSKAPKIRERLTEKPKIRKAPKIRERLTEKPKIRSKAPKIRERDIPTVKATPVTDTPQKKRMHRFVMIRNFIRENYSQFAWPKVTIANNCTESASQSFDFTPTQNFIRSYFTPRTDVHGMLLWHSVGTGKCHAKDTPILMYDGTIKMVQDIQVGDTLMGDDSTPRQVLSLARGQDEMYDVIPADGGDKYTVNKEHILVLKKDGDQIIEMEVQDYIKMPQSARKELKGFRTGVEFPYKEIDCDPYIIGSSLATSEDASRIPELYKCNNRDVRLKVLVGLLNGTETYSSEDKCFKIPQRSDTLTQDILYLARSLGFAAYVAKQQQEIHILEKAKDVLVTEIDVQHVGWGDYYGFTLDGNNRYLLGDFTVTHNTCTAIATASSAFEKEGYTILWVTRTTLKSDLWKNMFDQVCNMILLERGVKIPKDLPSRKRLLSKSWAIEPMSYKQFSNMIAGKNDYYKKLVGINGTQDPLRKTLLIIDEAHKIFGGGDDLKSVEKPDMKTLFNVIQKSYAISGPDSVKLLLMTATPITKNPMDFITMLNLLRDKDKQLPSQFQEFRGKYLTKEGLFKKTGKFAFLNDIAGYISYLNRERDPRQFAQPNIQYVNATMSFLDNVYTKTQLKPMKESEKSRVERDIKHVAAQMPIAKARVTEKKREECKGIKKTSEDCLSKPGVAQALQRVRQLENLKDKNKNKKKILQSKYKDLSSKLEDKSYQNVALLSRCNAE
jgi:hypothetical protein